MLDSGAPIGNIACTKRANRDGFGCKVGIRVIQAIKLCAIELHITLKP
jgi:hypothetical protein